MSARNCNVVILAAGRGERFAIEGISVPKPLIEFRGVSLLRRSVELAAEIAGGGRVIVVTTESVAATARELSDVDHVVDVSVTQRGPAASGLLAMAHLPADEPVVFMDCDNYYPEPLDWIAALPIGRNFLTVSEPPVGVPRSQFCNVRDVDGGVVELREKINLGDTPVATGIYGLATAADFFSGVMVALSRASSTAEISMSAALWFAAAQGLTPVTVPKWSPIGTPQQMIEAAKHG